MARTNYLGQHREFFGDLTPLSITAVKKGQVIRFNYLGKERNVFVVAGNWEGKLHGMDLASVPRTDFLRIVNALPTLSEKQLYEQEINKRKVLEFNAYRTYDRVKIANLRTILYDSLLQPAEEGEQDLDDPFVVTDQAF